MVTSVDGSGTFMRELKRRKVLRTGVYYVLVCVLILMTVGVGFPALGYETGQASKSLLWVALAGLPISLGLSWYFQLTPRGIVRTTSFVERRVLRNMAPINDQRHSKLSDHMDLQSAQQEFAWIVSAETGPLKGLRYGIADTLVLGSSLDCDIAVVSSHISPEHARLELKGDELTVRDLGSSNGTVVNGKAVQVSQTLQHEDELRLHEVVFRVTQSPQAPELA